MARVNFYKDENDILYLKVMIKKMIAAFITQILHKKNFLMVMIS